MSGIDQRFVSIEGDTYTLWLPKNYQHDGTKRLVLVNHGDSVNVPPCFDPFDGKNLPNWQKACKQVLDRGYPMLSLSAGGNLFGNDTAIASVDTAISYAQSSLGAKVDKVGLFGSSMGNATSMSWARQNRGKVGVIIGVCPAADLQAIYVNDGSTISAAMDAAYPSAWSNSTDGPAHNPATYGADLIALPTMLVYAASDPLIDPATVVHLAGLIGPSCRSINLGDIGSVHGDLTFGGMTANQTVDMVNFLDYYLTNA